MLIAALPLSVSAKTREVTEPLVFTTIDEYEEFMAAQPCGFTRDYTAYLTSDGYNTVMQDINLLAEDLVGVAFTNSSGPQSISLYAIDGGGNKCGACTLTPGDATAFYLHNLGPFTIFAKSLRGNNGNATFKVVLTRSSAQ